MDFFARVTEKADVPLSRKARVELRELLAARELDTPLFLFGANRDSESWADRLNVQGVIDDFASLPAEFSGRPVVRRQDVPTDSLVINCVTNSKPRVAMNQLIESGHYHSYFGADLQALFPEDLVPYQFVEDSRASLVEHQDRWQRLYEALNDDESQQVLEDILAYRLSGDPRVMTGYSYRPAEQYFENFLSLDTEVFVDGGSFDGETSELFAGLYPRYEKIYAFEPDPINFGRVQARLKNTPGVIFQPIGLSDSAGELTFEVGSGSASVVSELGSLKISVDTVDFVAPDATFIKLDLEGWELNALMGAESTIANTKPKLAVGAYHAPEHFLSIFEWVTSVREDYKVSLRHYTESWTESVLYFY